MTLGVMGELDVRILTELFGGQRDGGGAGSGVERRDLLCGAAQVGGDGGGEGVDGIDWAAVFVAMEESGFGADVYARVFGAAGAEVFAPVRASSRMRRMIQSRFIRPRRAMCCFRSRGREFLSAKGLQLPLARKLRDSIVSAAVGWAAEGCGCERRFEET